jgi:hypothetical protein
MDDNELIKLLLRVTAFGVVCIGLLVNFLWWRIALPYCVSAHNDGLLLTAFCGSVLIVAIDMLAIGFGGYVYKKLEAELLENNDEEA